VLLWLLACTPPASTPVDEIVDDYDPNAPIRERCFGEIGEDAVLPDYEDMGAVVPRHCMGTDHQDIDAVGRVVFLGDSITAGTPPTPAEGIYRALVTAGLQERFGSVSTDNCAEYGASVDDLLGPGGQFERCFTEPIDEPTLVVFTIGGNDMVDRGRELANGVPVEQVDATAAASLGLLEQAIRWLEDQDGVLFRGGVDVIFSNVYEYTDQTNDIGSCPMAEFFEVPEIDALPERYAALNESYVDLAVRTQTDIVLLFESFCGHGFHNEDPESPCYRGPGTPRWFDDTCIHPTPAGHAQLAEMVLAIVDE